MATGGTKRMAVLLKQLFRRALMYDILKAVAPLNVSLLLDIPLRKSISRILDLM